MLSCCLTSTEARWPVRDGGPSSAHPSLCRAHSVVSQRRIAFHRNVLGKESANTDWGKGGRDQRPSWRGGQVNNLQRSQKHHQDKATQQGAAKNASTAATLGRLTPTTCCQDRSRCMTILSSWTCKYIQLHAFMLCTGSHRLYRYFFTTVSELVSQSELWPCQTGSMAILVS